MAYSCPTCHEEFDSRRGLGVHHSQVHDERLPNRECANCGEEFYCEYEKTYCSESCHDEGVSYQGTAARNYQGKIESTDCEICGTEFEYYPSEKEGLYCSECVENEDWREPPSLEGEDHPRWKGGKLELECEVCDATVERYPSNVTGEVTVCSENCRAEWLSDSFAKSGHPNWEGGDNGSYGKGWNAVRRRALERDGYECVVCGKSREEIGRNPDVHHVVPVRRFAASESHSKSDAHYLDNVVSLCVDCHRKADFGQLSKARLRSLIPSRRCSPPAAAG